MYGGGCRVDWEKVLREAEELARQLRRARVDLNEAVNEAEKALTFYLYKNCNEEAMRRYLNTMATNPPPRSKKTQRYYCVIRDLWEGWRTDLSGRDKARAWGWAVRLAKVGK